MKITRVKSNGPLPIRTPFMVNDVDVNSKAYTVKSSLDNYHPFELINQNTPYINISDIRHTAGNNLYFIEFSFTNQRYVCADVNFLGPEDFYIYLDGIKLKDSKLTLEPATHTVSFKYIANEHTPVPEISLESKNSELLCLKEDNLKAYTIKDVILGTRFNTVSLSNNGKYLITGYTSTLPGGKTKTAKRITDIETNRIVMRTEQDIKWMPKSNCYYYVTSGTEGENLIIGDPDTGEESVLAKNIPDGNFRISPDETFLLYTITQKGPEENKDVYQVIEPDDRQPNWRDRSYIAKYDLSDREMQQVTFGFNNSSVKDIAPDGKSILVITEQSRLSKRPTQIRTLYKINLSDNSAETLITDDGFISSAIFSPDGNKILISGSPEALNSIGINVKPGQTPNMYDIQLYIMDLASKEVTPITKEFNPSVQNFEWSKYDNNIYFTAENLDCIDLYCYNTSTNKISEIKSSEDLVNGFSIASTSGVLAYFGQGASNSDRAYIIDLKKNKEKLYEDLSAAILNNIQLGKCVAWDFVNSKGDTINGRYYLPPHFDPTKKYPLIVNYYGGCSPTSRNFESRYPQHAYAALGYVVYVVNPSGATGFGQEFSARHVNTAGHGPAEDIIEGTKQFCKEHSFINAEKIGCIGASYGGFMTQYLQTQTDIFAAAISHAGISDHTSYWGEGYWGYSYSEVAMANSYPWSHQNLYVKQSPLYNADKINTPILFLHGDVDTNVPVGESIQMYTALKLLGKETAMVLVKDQDHHIKEYEKRIRWQNTIWAWFAKWLQDDPTWWDAIYIPKSL